MGNSGVAASKKLRAPPASFLCLKFAIEFRRHPKISPSPLFQRGVKIPERKFPPLAKGDKRGICVLLQPMPSLDSLSELLRHHTIDSPAPSTLGVQLRSEVSRQRLCARAHRE